MADWRYPRSRRSKGERGDPCDGCRECALRCTSGVQMSKDEFERIIEHLRKSDPAKVASVLNQDKHRVWFEDITSEACLFQDVVSRRCIVYPVRPLVCRLFGRVEWLPCPLERELPQLHEGVKLMQTYARLRRATFPEWCAEAGIFDPSQVVGKPR